MVRIVSGSDNQEAMKLLFLYKDGGHARPLRLIRSHLRERGIDMGDYHCRSLADCREHLGRKADLLVAHHELMPAAIEYQHAPILVCDRIDGSQLAGSREWLDRPNVLGAMKSYRYRTPELNNQYKGRYLAHLLSAAGIKSKPGGKSMKLTGEPKQLTTEQLGRIHLMYGFGSHEHVGGCAKQDINFDVPRPFDVHFAGTLSYSGSEVEVHRELAVKVTKAYKGSIACAGGNTMRCNVYRELMLRSKAVVSPWGCGEACHRDYEAMLLGAVLIKPRSDHVECWPDIYQDEYYVPCEHDFSDLHDRIRFVKENWSSLRQMRVRCRRLIVETRTPDYVADKMVALFQKVLQ